MSEDKRWRITNWIDEHKFGIAGVTTGAATLAMMVYSETGADAVICLFVSPVLFCMIMGLLDGFTD
jgi:hypothetical protein